MESILGTCVVGGVLLLTVTAIIWKMIRDKRKGKSLSCGCDCGKCNGCH